MAEGNGMTEQADQDSLGVQIYQRMAEKETEELVAIWQENDHQAWSDKAFAAVKTLLLERLGALPEPEVEDQTEDADNVVVAYPTDKKLIWIADLSSRLSWVILIVAILYALFKLISNYYLGNWSEWASGGGVGIFTMLTMIASVVDSALYAGFTFLVLQAIAEGIYLLLDIRDLVQSDTDIEVPES